MHAACMLARLPRPQALDWTSLARPPPLHAPAVYVVFGATGGIGSELCKRLAAQPGASVVMVGRDGAKLDAVKAGLGAPIAATYTADVTDSAAVEKVINAVAESYGRIDGVANCVGSIVLKSAHTTSDAEFDQTVKLNLYSCFNILKPSVKKMMASGGGSIVFCSSAVAKHGIPNHEAIAAAKAGVVGECVNVHTHGHAGVYRNPGAVCTAA